MHTCSPKHRNSVLLTSARRQQSPVLRIGSPRQMSSVLRTASPKQGDLCCVLDFRHKRALCCALVSKDKKAHETSMRSNEMNSKYPKSVPNGARMPSSVTWTSVLRTGPPKQRSSVYAQWFRQGKEHVGCALAATGWHRRRIQRKSPDATVSSKRSVGQP